MCILSPVIQEQARERVSGGEGIVVLAFGRDVFTRVYSAQRYVQNCVLYSMYTV